MYGVERKKGKKKKDRKKKRKTRKTNIDTLINIVKDFVKSGKQDKRKKII
jgi:hypothetical protein